MRALRILVAGRVQGVGFRWFAERQANRHRITGFARNLPDGRVEVVAQGDERDLEEFCTLLRRGPAHAEVDEWESTDVPVDLNLFDFRTRF